MPQAGYDDCACCGRMYKSDGSEFHMYVDDHERDEFMSKTFPLEWNEWRGMWESWLSCRLQDGSLHRSAWKFPEKNFMADEVLGVFGIPNGDGTGTIVELSEGRFLDHRFVGITFGGDGDTITSGGTVDNFADLEHALGLDV